MLKIILYIFCLSMLVSCVDNSYKVIENPKTYKIAWATSTKSYNQVFSVIEIDSCEYIVGVYDRSRFLSHKGNCKFCLKRQNKFDN